MKHLKRVLALVVAMVMVMGMMSTVAFADEQDTTIEITGLTEGDVVTFYKVVEWGGDATGNVSGWIPTSDYASVLTADVFKKAIDSNADGYTGLTSELAGDLARVANGKSSVGTDTAEADGKASLDISTLGLGLYIAIITPADAKIVYNPVFVAADYVAGNNTHAMTEDSSYYNKSAAKKSEVTLTKTSENASDYNGDNGDTAAIGDVLTFTVNTTIPGYGNTFDYPSFVLEDTMTNLELQTGTLTIKDSKGNDLTEKATIEKDADHYKVTFKVDYLKSLNIPTDVVITYDAKVKAEEEVANVDKENNTVTIAYSHDPSTETNENPGGDKEYKKDVTNHYTFSIDADNLFKSSKIVNESGSEIIKVAVDSDGNPITSTKVYSNVTSTEYEQSPLAGATFKLYKVDAEGNKTGDAIATATSDSEGRIKFEGLDAGKYVMIESAAPTGYVRDTSEHTIEITANVTSHNVTEYYDQAGNWYEEAATGRTAYTYDAKELDSYKVSFDGTDASSYTFVNESTNSTIKWSEAGSSEAPASIKNTKGVELPSTGGVGTTIFYVVGAILVLGAGVVLVTRRRMSAN